MSASPSSLRCRSLFAALAGLLAVPDQLQVSDHLFTDHDPHPTEDYSVTRILSESSNIGTRLSRIQAA